MREEFEQHCGHLRHTGFEITLVPHPAARPVGLESRAHVLGDVRHHVVREVTRCLAAAAVAELVACCAVYAKCAYYGVVHRSAGIGVECETEVYRNAQAFTVGKHRRATRKPVHPQAAATVIVSVVVYIIRRREDAVGRACPLQEITRAFGETRISACHIFIINGIRAIFYFTGHIAHAAAEFHGICRYHGLTVLARIAELDYGLVPVALFEREVPEIYPCPAAHLLVDGEAVVAVCGFYCIFCCRSAVGKRYIAHIHGIFPVGRNFCFPLGRGCRAFLS